MRNVEQSPLSRFNRWDKEFWYKRPDHLVALGLITLTAITWATMDTTLRTIGLGSGAIAVSSPITFPAARATIAQARWMFRRNGPQNPQPQS